jgi:hypothetical protein
MMLILNRSQDRTFRGLGSNNQRNTMTIDVWNEDTWELLTEARQRLRDEIFEATCERQKRRAEEELSSVEHDISQGLTKAIPF